MKTKKAPQPLKNTLEKRTSVLMASLASGFSIMLLEVCGVRLLGPYFGTSIVVWTNILSVILVALSAGSLYGGLVYRKNPNKNLIPQLFTYSGLAIVMIPLMSDYISRSIFILLSKNVVYLVFFGSLLSSILIFGGQFFILGMIGPYLISHLNNKYPESNNVGWAISLSTMGGLLGTILPTVLVIPVLGTKFCIVFSGLLLFGLGSLGFFKKRYLLSIVFIMLLTNYSPRTYDKSVIQKESKEQYIKIYNINNIKYLSFDSGLGIQSIYNPDSILTGNYYDYVNTLPEFVNKKSQIKILILGLAGGTTARELVSYYGDNIQIDGVEKDSEVINLAREYMNLPERIRVINQDARIFLSTTDNTYDVVYLDAFSNEFQIPWHLTTLEFWSLVSKHLNEGGVVGMNVFSLKRDGGAVVNSLSATSKKIFTHVYQVPINETNNQNLLLLMSNENLSPSKMPNKNTSPDLVKINTEIDKNMREFEENIKYKILTDDSAPLELLTFSDLLE